MARLDVLLKTARDMGASDLHVLSGYPPVLRILGEIQPVDFQVITSDQCRKLLYEIMSEEQVARLEKGGDCDFSYEIPGELRVRANVFEQNNGISAALREDPNIIMVGEMRDSETIALALTAAEIGQLVFGTLHTSNAAQTVNRIIDAFPSGDQDQVRAVLADSLQGVVAQRLLRSRDGKGRTPAVEIMFVTQAVSVMIREKKTFQIMSAMQTGKKEGMQLMEDSLLQLVREGRVTPEDAGVTPSGTVKKPIVLPSGMVA